MIHAVVAQNTQLGQLTPGKPAVSIGGDLAIVCSELDGGRCLGKPSFKLTPRYRLSTDIGIRKLGVVAGCITSWHQSGEVRMNFIIG